MKKFYFIKRNPYTIIGSILFLSCSCLLFILGLISVFINNCIYNVSIFSVQFDIVVFSVFFLTLLIVSIITLIMVIKDYRKTYEVGEGKIKFNRKYSDYGNPLKHIADISADKSNKMVYNISSIPFIFITRKQSTKIGVSVIENEKINGKKQVMGQCYLLNKFVYDKERCFENSVFERLNKRNDYKSQFYEVLCSMYYQEGAFDALLGNGFCGDIYLSQAIYKPRKQSFDEMFKKYNVSAEKIHLVE